jgi:hypothetical protein
MPRICYIAKNFGPAALQVIREANAIIADYAAQGYDLTLRQLYYQFVSRDLIPNRQSEYKRLGDIINDARLAGLVDWEAIVDRTRNIRALSHWSDPGRDREGCGQQLRRGQVGGQPRRVEVRIEKDALVGVSSRSARSSTCPYSPAAATPRSPRCGAPPSGWRGTWRPVRRSSSSTSATTTRAGWT